MVGGEGSFWCLGCSEAYRKQFEQQPKGTRPSRTIPSKKLVARLRRLALTIRIELKRGLWLGQTRK
jgi:hypothetical protein